MSELRPRIDGPLWVSCNENCDDCSPVDSCNGKHKLICACGKDAVELVQDNYGCFGSCRSCIEWTQQFVADDAQEGAA